jgi:hypothetical protein
VPLDWPSEVEAVSEPLGMQPVGTQHSQVNRGREVAVVGIQQAAEKERPWPAGDLALKRTIAASLGRPPRLRSRSWGNMLGPKVPPAA